MPRLVKLNWDEECEKDFIISKGFEITQPAFKKDVKCMYGAHSPLFATDYEDEDAFQERYKCKCGELKGKVYKGEKCPVCRTRVKFRDVDFKMTGWIKLKEDKFIHPIFFNMLRSVIGATAFNEIIEINKNTNKNGIVVEEENSKNPFKGLGITGFIENFDDIMVYYKRKNKKKKAMIEEILRERKKIFASSIPVFSSVLRPLYFKGETHTYTPIDRKYNIIYSLSRLLNNDDVPVVLEIKKKKKDKKPKLDNESALYILQMKLMELWELVFCKIDKKDGHIREFILGGRLNFSSRDVIIPDDELKADEIKLGYVAFLELYKYEVIAHLVKMNDITENEAYEQWFKATINFNPKIYELMMYLVKKFKPKVLINRNPSINYGSILVMKIIEIKPDLNDYTMSLPIQILKVLNADFDGDILNVVSLKTKKLSKAFDKIFNPRKNMFISRNDGLFNDDFNLFKDQIIGLLDFNTI